MTPLRRTLILISASIVVLGAIVFAVIQYRQYSNKNIAAIATEEAESPEFFLEQSLSTVYRDDGSIDYQFNSEYLEHFKKSDSIQGKMVYFIFFGQDGLTWHARADKVIFLNKNKKIVLSDNVRIWRPERNVELTTDKITFNEAREYAETASPVTIKSTAGLTHSIGLKVDLNRENLQLLSAVTGLYHVKK